MTQGERVKEIRKALGLSQEAFGEKIGITRASISNMEKGTRNPSDQTIKSICREFNVDYFWLTEGIGNEMFIEKENDSIKLVAEEYGLTDSEADMIVKFLKLTPNEREILTNIINKLSDNK